MIWRTILINLSLSISTTRFLTHCLTTFSWLHSQVSTTGLSVSFIFPLWLFWSAIVTVSPVCAFMVAANNSTLGCGKPSGINYDLENIHWHEWLPYFFKYFVHVVTNTSFWLASTSSNSWKFRLIVCSNAINIEQYILGIALWNLILLFEIWSSQFLVLFQSMISK